ncbi:TATA-binding protein interacting [Bisporella sp. PMI_857]|nr:TATA-binding protein interacting [Bisporella sp. PMI_857]
MASAQISQNPTSQTVAGLLPKLHDADPDFRFMSLNDLYQVLTIGKPDFLHNDYNTAARAVDGIIKTLDDQNGEVQNLAIKCLSPLVSKIPNAILAPLLEKLSILDLENSVDNSIPAMALRTVVITLPRPVSGVAPSKEVNEAYTAISRVLIPRLVGVKLPPPPPGMLDLETAKDIDPEAVDVLIEPPEVEALQALLISILESERASSVVKKRAVVAISILASYLSDTELSAFISQLIETLRNPHLTPIQRRLYITILGSMARSIPSRFGPYLKTLAPFVLAPLSATELEEQLEDAAEDGEPNLEADDVREAALVALEGFLASCGSEMRPYTEETISSALRFLKYDPNYNDDDDDEEMGGTQQDEDELSDSDDEFEADAGFDDDDDDASWKVRRCAAKTLYTLISTRGSGDLLDDGTLYTQIAPILVQRFNEREENVRLEIIATSASLVRKTGGGIISHVSIEDSADFAHSTPISRKRRRESSSNFDSNTLLSTSAGLASPTAEPLPATGPRADLARLSPSIIKVVAKLLKGNSIPTKQALVNLLDDMIAVQNGGLGEYFAQIIEPIVDTIKTTAGSTSSSSITTGGAASATVHTMRIAALRLVADICKTHSSTVLQPYLPKIVPGVISAVTEKYYKISSEAISTVEELVKALTPPRSRSLKQSQQEYLQQLYDAIINRVSSTEADVEVRQRAIRALGILLARTLSLEGVPLLNSESRTAALDLLHDRLKNETTRLAAVRAVDNIAALSSSKDQLQAKWIREVSLELSAQLRKANRALRGASLGALKNLVIAPASRSSLDRSTIEGLVGTLLPLLTTKDLHLLGPALIVLAYLVLDDPKLVTTPQLDSAVCELLKSDTLGGSVLEALLTLVKNIGQKGAGQPLMSGLLKDVSINGDPTVVGKVIGTLLVYGGPSVGVKVEDFAEELNNPHVLGEAGLRQGGKSTLRPSTFLNQFKRSDKVRLAAAVALGRAGAGNIPIYLPEILNTMDKGGNAQYLLLHSIKEILQQATNHSADISNYTNNIWDRLLQASQAEDNKAVGAECIGRLAIIDPKTFMPQLQAYLRDPTPSPDLIIPNLGQLLPFVMRESVIKPELIREVMMGPFKHKSAYETLYSLMETAFSRINIVEFYDRVVDGLKDEHDIRSLCNLMLTKLVVLDPDETARRLDSIADAFRTILSTKLKDNAVKQEIEKQEEAVKGALRISVLLYGAIPGVSSGIAAQGGQHQTWRTYWEWIEKDFSQTSNKYKTKTGD